MEGLTSQPQLPAPVLVLDLLFHEQDGQMFVLAGEKSDKPLPFLWCCLFANRAEACKQLEAAHLLNRAGAEKLRNDTFVTNAGVAFVKSAKLMSRIFYVVPITPPC